MTTHIIEVNDIAGLSDYRLVWKSLLEATHGASFYQSLDWLEAYWRHGGSGQRLRALVVHAMGEVIGILPLVVRIEQTPLGPLRVLTYPLHERCTFYAPIGRQAAATLNLAMRHLAATPRDWDLLELRGVDRVGRDHHRTQNAMRLAGFHAYEESCEETALIDLPDKWNDYWSSRQRRWRANVDRNDRRLQKQGCISFIRYRPQGTAYGDDDPRWGLYDACRRIVQNSWQGSLVDGDVPQQPYLRETHLAAVRGGGLDLNLLLIGGVPAAFAYNLHFNGHVSAINIGYDPNVTSYGARNVLLAHVVRDSILLGDRTLDLGSDNLHWKRYWQTSSKASYRYSHFPRAVMRAQLLRLNRWLAGRLDAGRKPAVTERSYKAESA